MRARLTVLLRSLWNVRSPEMLCFSRQRAPVSISSKITSTAAVFSRNLWRGSDANWAAVQPGWPLLKSLSRKVPTMPRNLQPDRQLFGVTLALCFIGAVMVFSASAVTAGQQTGNGYTFLLRQVLWIAIGIAGMFKLMNTDYRNLRQPRVIFTALSVTLMLLVAVFFLDRSHATHRWARLGPLSFQPSELAKIVVIFFLAWFLANRSGPRSVGVNDPFRTLVPVLGTILLIVGLVVAEPDLGTACMISLIAFVMLYVAGLSLRYVAVGVLAALPV